MTRWLLLTGVLLLIPESAAGADWTEFLGPRGDGISEIADLPLTWAEDQNILWKVPVPGMGWSSPVVASDRIFLTTAVPQEGEQAGRQSLRVLCLDAQSGRELWNTEVFRHAAGEKVEMHQKNSHASPTPIVDGPHVYVHFGPHGTACLKQDGSIVWKNTELTYLPQHGNGGSPALTNSHLIICCDGKDVQYVSALRRDNGHVAWKTDRGLKPTKGFSFCTPTVVNVNGQMQAICPGSAAVIAYDPADGTEIWRVDYGEGYSVVPRPQYANGLIYVCSGFGDEQIFAIDPTGRGNITSTHVRWTTKKGTPKSPSFLVRDNLLFMVSDSGVASCLNALTGESLWQQRLGGNYSASPLLAGDRIYFQSETGTTTVVDADETYEVRAKNQIGDGMIRTFASFAVIEHDLLLRSETHLYRISRTP